MALYITLTAAGLIGIAYGITKKNNQVIVLSVIELIMLGIIYWVYSYLYSLTPY